MKHLYFSLLCLLLGHHLYAQSIAGSNLYQYNYSLVNPAYTGAEATHQISVIGKREGFEQAYPFKSGMLSYETFIKKIHSGIGAMATLHDNGIIRTSRYSLLYSYAFTLPDSSQLRLGTNFSLDRLVIDYSKYRYHDHPDPVLSNGKMSDKAASVGVGVWYSRRKLFAGFSADYLNQPTFFNQEGFIGASYYRNFRLTFGFQDLRLARNFTITPSLNHIRFLTAIPVASDILYYNTHYTDVNNTFAYKKMVLLGLGYRLPKSGFKEGSFLINGGIRIARRFQLMGMAYAQNHSSVRKEGFNGELLLKVML